MLSFKKLEEKINNSKIVIKINEITRINQARKAFRKRYEDKYGKEADLRIKKDYDLLFKGLFLVCALYLIVSILSVGFGIGYIKSQSIDKHFILYGKHIESIAPAYTKYGGLKNELIYFLFPIDTPYFPKDSKFAKYVRCESGEVLKVDGLKYYCNDELLGVARTSDSKGNPIKPFVYNGVIPQGKYFVMGTHEKSFDSRYWGFLDYSLIKGVSVWSF